MHSGFICHNIQGMEWNLIEHDPPAFRKLAQTLSCPETLARLLLYRGLTDPQQAESFMAPSLNRLTPPFNMKDMDRAVARILEAIRRREKVAVYGDYDADGLTATAVLILFLRPFLPGITEYIPHRVKEGYGIGPLGLETLSQQKVQLIITVDCGVSNHDTIARARELGLEVIVTDHHEVPRRGVPEAAAVVNPKQEGCPFPFKGLAGVGVAYNLVIALRQALDREGLLPQGKPNLRGYLDLVTLGTLADMSPLRDENRIYVTEGLKVLQETDRPAVQALKEVSGMNPRDPVSAGDVSFRLAPRLNALGRLKEAREGVELLVTSEAAQARALAEVMDQENRRRQELEQAMIEEIETRIAGDPDLYQRKCLVLSSADWSRGLLGLVASRLVERWFRPVFLFGLDNGLAHGSGRSIGGFHLVRGLEKLEDRLVRFGGHAAAAGATLRAALLPEFARDLEQLVEQTVPPEAFIPTLNVEAETDFPTLVGEVLPHLPSLAPFGEGNPEP
ncbi:MAG: single-stranded-DNA-specific exonuclease RecJ, partial [Desulfobacterota bacterium]|nr:single-stranded-DNA-specific exonuclease RecJ [Thermodesulfobacteriota bacterium]